MNAGRAAGLQSERHRHPRRPHLRHRHPRHLRRRHPHRLAVRAASIVVATVTVIGVAASSLFISAVAVSPASSGASQVTGSAPHGGPYYVAVGASESVGVQPTTEAEHNVRTKHGYANDLVKMERTRWPGLQLKKLGCPGITVQAALHGGSRCTYPNGSEVQTAVDFLRAHRGNTVLVSVDLGFNDVWPCLVHRAVDRACVSTALTKISRTLPVVLARLRAAAGPRTVIVGLEHNDPALAGFLLGPRRRELARAGAVVIARLNHELSSIYRRAGALVANVPAAYGTKVTDPTRLAGHGTVAYRVARICQLTWICDAHNLHPNDAGYRVIAMAIAAALAGAPQLHGHLAGTRSPIARQGPQTGARDA